MSSSIDRFLQIAIDKKASDIYLISDSEIALKIEGEHVILSDMANQDELMQFINEILPQHVKDAVLSRKEVDVIYSYGGHRFRMNVHFQSGALAFSVRLIP